MFNRKKLYRERLEMYLVYVMLAYRRITLFFGLFWVVAAAYAFPLDLRFGVILLGVSVFLLAMGSSYPLMVWTARTIARLVVWLKKDF